MYQCAKPNRHFRGAPRKQIPARNCKAAYTVHFETPELVKKCVTALDKEPSVSPLHCTIQRGEQTETASFDAVKHGEALKLEEAKTSSPKASAKSAVKFDIIGKLAEETKLTRTTIAAILQGMNLAVFN